VLSSDASGLTAQHHVVRFMAELKRRGLRVTSQRIGVARIVLHEVCRGGHPSFNHVMNLAKRVMPSISGSTVYNTLRLLEALGFIQSFSLNGETVYDKPEPHVNIACTRSGRIIDAPSSLVDYARRELRVKVRNIVVYADC